MHRVSLTLLIATFCSAAGFTTTAFAQVGAPGVTGGLRMTPVVSEPTGSAPSTDGFFSQFFAYRNFRGWGTSVVARPAYRTPALVLRERVGMNKPR